MSHLNQENKNHNSQRHIVDLGDSLTNVFNQLKKSEAKIFALEKKVQRERITSICVMNDIAKVELPNLAQMWRMTDDEIDCIYNQVMQVYSEKIAKIQ